MDITIRQVLEDDLYYALALVWICVMAFAAGLALGGVWILLV